MIANDVNLEVSWVEIVGSWIAELIDSKGCSLNQQWLERKKDSWPRRANSTIFFNIFLAALAFR